MKNKFKFIILTLLVSTSLLAQQPNEIKIKVEYKDVTRSKPLDYVTSIKESLDKLEEIAKKKSLQYDENEKQRNQNIENNVNEVFKDAHQTYLRVIKLGILSKVVSLEDGSYKAVVVRESKQGKYMLEKFATILSIKNNKIVKIQTQEIDQEKYLQNCVLNSTHFDQVEHDKCAERYKFEVVLLAGEHFINSKFENGVISIIDLKTYETKEFILVDEIIKVLEK